MSRKRIAEKLNDLYIGVYGSAYEPENGFTIFHGGDAPQFCRFVAAVSAAFQNLPVVKCEHYSSWPRITMPWNLDEWDTIDSLAKAIYMELKSE